MFKKIIFFFLFITSSFALNKPELNDEIFFDFNPNPPRILKPYDFIVFSNDTDNIFVSENNNKSDKTPENNKKTEVIKAEFCKSFFLADNAKLSDKNQFILDEAKQFLKIEDKLFVDVYYKKDIEFNQREFRRNSVKKSFAIQNYLNNKNVDKAQIFISNIETENKEKINKVILRINSNCQ